MNDTFRLPRSPSNIDNVRNIQLTQKEACLGKRMCVSEFLPSRSCKATCYAFKSPPSWQELMLVTRELLLLHSDEVITVPVVQPPARVWVVTVLPQFQREDSEYDQNKSKNLMTRIKSKGLVSIRDEFGINPPPNDVWQDCLQFSIQARMAPNWNRVGFYLFYGRDFLTSTVIDAVKPQLRTSYDEISKFSQIHNVDCMNVKSQLHTTKDTNTERVYMYLEGCQFRWKRIDLSDLRIQTDKHQKYVRGEINAISHHYIGVSRLCVLPNLTTGRLLSVTRRIQQCKDITNWASMKRYWKNLYGYRLPSDEANGAKFYCNIIFDQCYDLGRPTDKTIYCYPESCVRLHEPIKVFRHKLDREKIMDQFLVDLSLKVPNVCGLPLQFLAKPMESNFDSQRSLIQGASKRTLDKTLDSTTDSTQIDIQDRKKPNLDSSMNRHEE